MPSPVIRQATLTTSPTSIFTVPASTTEYISKVVVCNTSGADRLYRIWLTSGPSPTTDNAVIYDRQLFSSQPLATEDITDLVGFALPTGWVFWAYASGTGVSITIQTMSV